MAGTRNRNRSAAATTATALPTSSRKNTSVRMVRFPSTQSLLAVVGGTDRNKDDDVRDTVVSAVVNLLLLEGYLYLNVDYTNSIGVSFEFQGACEAHTTAEAVVEMEQDVQATGVMTIANETALLHTPVGESFTLSLNTEGQIRTVSWAPVAHIEATSTSGEAWRLSGKGLWSQKASAVAPTAVPRNSTQEAILLEAPAQLSLYSVENYTKCNVTVTCDKVKYSFHGNFPTGGGGLPDLVACRGRLYYTSLQDLIQTSSKKYRLALQDHLICIMWGQQGAGVFQLSPPIRSGSTVSGSSHSSSVDPAAVTPPMKHKSLEGPGAWTETTTRQQKEDELQVATAKVTIKRDDLLIHVAFKLKAKVYEFVGNTTKPLEISRKDWTEKGFMFIQDMTALLDSSHCRNFQVCQTAESIRLIWDEAATASFLSPQHGDEQAWRVPGTGVWKESGASRSDLTDLSRPREETPSVVVAAVPLTTTPPIPTPTPPMLSRPSTLKTTTAPTVPILAGPSGPHAAQFEISSGPDSTTCFVSFSTPTGEKYSFSGDVSFGKTGNASGEGFLYASNLSDLLDSFNRRSFSMQYQDDGMQFTWGESGVAVVRASLVGTGTAAGTGAWSSATSTERAVQEPPDDTTPTGAVPCYFCFSTRGEDTVTISSVSVSLEYGGSLRVFHAPPGGCSTKSRSTADKKKGFIVAHNAAAMFETNDFRLEYSSDEGGTVVIRWGPLGMEYGSAVVKTPQTASGIITGAGGWTLQE